MLEIKYFSLWGSCFPKKILLIDSPEDGKYPFFLEAQEVHRDAILLHIFLCPQRLTGQQKRYNDQNKDNAPLYICTTSSLSIHQSLDI